MRSAILLLWTLASLALLAALCAGRASAAGGVYVALGDSYTSGPLIPNQHGDPIGCGRSDHNYPSLVDAAVSPAVFRDVSCGSAVTDNMTQPQSVPFGGTNPPQFGALSADASLVTIGIGGNDADLVGIAEKCLELDLFSPNGSPCKDHYTVNGQDTAIAGIDAIAPKIAAVLAGIHARSPRARVLLVGYPAVLPLSGPGCWPMVPVSSGDVPWFRSLIVHVNSVLAAQAAGGGAEYVDTYTGSEGHDVCTLPPNRWFEGPIPTMPAYPLHPNALGEASMARSVLAVLAHPVPGPASGPWPAGLRITGWRLAGRRLIVRGSVAPAFHGRVSVRFAPSRRGNRRLAARGHAQVRAGRWRAVLRLRGRPGRRLAHGRITASVRAGGGFLPASARART